MTFCANPANNLTALPHILSLDATGADVETFWMRKPIPPTPPKFVDADAAQGMNIGLSRGFPPFEDVAVALETFDLDMLPVEFVVKLIAWDLDSLRLKGQEHKGDPPELIARADKAEQLCIAVSSLFCTVNTFRMNPAHTLTCCPPVIISWLSHETAC